MMEGSTSSRPEMNSIAFSIKKRKLQYELPEMPLPKHVCLDRNGGGDFSPFSNTEPKEVESYNKFARGEECESDQDSAKAHDDSFHSNGDPILSTNDEAETDIEYPDICASNEPSTSSEMSSESRSMTKSSSSQTESLSINEQFNRPHYQNGFDPSLNDEGRLVVFENRAELDKELEKLLYENGVDPSNCVLANGRWSVNQDAQQEDNKLAIDKDFEQYFSMLML